MKQMLFGNRLISTENPAFIMGIVNCTPDSFYSGSRGNTEQSIERALKLIAEGADVLDFGGESTRPGSEYVSEEEEINRLVPVIKAVRKQSDIPISIDTRKKNVMKACYEEGADVLNDVSALEDDCEMVEFVAQKKLGLILMHKKGIPVSMQDNPVYEDVFNEVSNYLLDRANWAMSFGIEKEKIIVDPGIGFGKDFNQNIELIKNCGKLCNGTFPVLMALSRKKCIGQMTQKEDAKDRLTGTVVADVISVIKGASMVRVHDVGDCRDSFMVLKSLL